MENDYKQRKVETPVEAIVPDILALLELIDIYLPLPHAASEIQLLNYPNFLFLFLSS